MKKLITAEQHGLIDYGIITSMLIYPTMLDLNKKSRTLYAILGSNLAIYNALTDNGVSVKPLIPFDKHYKIDFGNLAMVAALGAFKFIWKDKKARCFHAAILTTAAATVLLTDPNSRKKKMNTIW